MTKKVAKKSGQVTDKPSGKSSGRAMVKQPHGGALLPGAGGGPQPGSGRPPDALRAALRDLGMAKGVPLISSVLDGKITVSLLGKCDACEHEQKISEEWVELIMTRIKTTVDQQLKANEQALKYGMQTKELVIANDNAASFFDCISAAAGELFGGEGADALKARAMVLMEGKK